MALNLKDEEALRLAGEVAELTGESKTGAIRVALRERLERLGSQPSREIPEQRRERLQRFLEDEVWPQVPPGLLGSGLSKQEREEILGYGPGGV
jgi:antitoxin VapB